MENAYNDMEALSALHEHGQPNNPNINNITCMEALSALHEHGQPNIPKINNNMTCMEALSALHEYGQPNNPNINNNMACMEALCAEQLEKTHICELIFWRQHLDVKLWVMAIGLEPPHMLAVSMAGNWRLAKGLGNEVAGFLVVPHFMECSQVDKPVHPTLG